MMTEARRPLTRRGLLSIGMRALAGGSVASLLGACAPVASGGPSGAPVRRLSWLVPQDPPIAKFARSAIAPPYETSHPGATVEGISPVSGRHGPKLPVLATGRLGAGGFFGLGGVRVFTLW